MTKGDVDKLFSLLRELYPRQPQSETAERKLAWFLALKPYEYEAVRAAALAHARKSDYYPSVSEITAGLPVPRETEEEKPRGAHAWMKKYLTPEYDARWHDSGVSKYARERGLSWEQAKQEMVDNWLYVPA